MPTFAQRKRVSPKWPPEGWRNEKGIMYTLLVVTKNVPFKEHSQDYKNLILIPEIKIFQNFRIPYKNLGPKS